MFVATNIISSWQAYFCRDKTFDTMILVAAPANDTKLFFVIETNQHRYLDCIPERKREKRRGRGGMGEKGGRHTPKPPYSARHAWDVVSHDRYKPQSISLINRRSCKAFSVFLGASLHLAASWKGAWLHCTYCWGVNAVVFFGVYIQCFRNV